MYAKLGGCDKLTGMWSHEISQMTGQFTQQSLMQGAYANSIGMANPGFAANQMAGTAMSGLAGVGAPVATAGLSLLGLDPMGMGLRAGMAALPTLGLGGAIGAGAAVAAPVAAGYYAASAVGNQMMTGMQQQQGLNTTMRQNFSQFQNGGQGFNNAQLAGLGTQMRGMTHEVGSGGEMQSFRELSSLAANMGKMGFVQTTRDVQQFGQKFRQMVDTLKTVAKDLGTNLEAAQEMTAGMRGSGIFQSADQIRMAQMMRGNAVSGNISTMETGQMMNIGSQIARSIGGRGRQGAFAGAKTIGQIGSALESGTLNEEDIFNATGQTGAAGRTALATSMMQNSAQFLRSNRGRVMLASLAGQNGQLDETAVQQLMGGGMGLSGTMQGVGRNMQKVGAANFMRNEGRLRSAVLERFGGNVQTMQLMQWAGQSGIDIESMGDMESIFAKRMLGMDDDQLTAAVKMARDFKQNAQFAGERQSQDKWLQGTKDRKSGQGIAGVQNSFNRFRERVQGGLQEVGQNLYNSASDWIERQINEMTGMYATTLNEAMRGAYLDYERSGGTATGRGDMVLGALRRGSSAMAPGARNMSSARMGLDFSQEALNAASVGGSGGPGAAQTYRGYAQGGTGLVGALNRAMGNRTLEDQTGFHFSSETDTGMGARFRGGFRSTLDATRRPHADGGKGFGSVPQALVGGLVGALTSDAGLDALENVEFGAYERNTNALLAGARVKASQGDMLLAKQIEGKLTDPRFRARLSGKHGEEHIRELNKIINEEGTDDVKQRWNSLYGGSVGGAKKTKDGQIVVGGRARAHKELGAFATALTVSGGLGDAAFNQRAGTPFDALAGLGAGSTEMQREDAYGKALMAGYTMAGGEAGMEINAADFWAGRGGGPGGMMKGKLGLLDSMNMGFGGGGLGSALMGMADYASGGAISGYLRDVVTGDRSKATVDERAGKEMYRFLKTEEGRSMATRAFYGDLSAEFTTKLDDDLKGLMDDIATNKDPAQRAKLEITRASLAAANLRKSGGTEEERQKIAEQLYMTGGIDKGQARKLMEGSIAGVHNTVMGMQGEEGREYLAERGGMARGEIEKLSQSGMYSGGELKANIGDALRAAGAGGAAQYFTSQMSRWQKLSEAGSMASGGDVAGGMGLYEQATGDVGAMKRGLRGMSSAQLAAAEKVLRTTEGGEAGLPAIQREQALAQRAARTFGHGGQMADVGVAKLLGVTGQQNLINVSRATTAEGMIGQIAAATGAELSAGQRDELMTIRKLARGEEVTEKFKRKASQLELDMGKADEDGMIDDTRTLKGEEGKREALERAGNLKRDLDQDALKKNRGERLSEQQLKDPLQAEILAALATIAENTKTQVKDDQSGTKAAKREVEFGPKSMAALDALKKG